MSTTTPIQSEANVPADAIVQEPPASPRIRLTSLDAYRGFVMLLMASEGLGIGEVAKEHGTSGVWQYLKFQVDHVQWIGCSLWDMIQPSFSFLVGVALVFSFAKRQAEGQSFKKMLGHAVVRSLALIALGIFLRSDGRKQTYFTFEDTLSQIGLGYTFLFLLARTKPKVQLAAALSLLVLYWAAFALYPLPQIGFDYNSVGVHADWPHLQGFAAHWDKNTNFASGFDQWFLNLFPREKPFVFNGGGYLTLSFIPTLGTMIFGLLAGGLLKSDKPGTEKLRILLITGLACLIVGWMLGVLGICPVVKRIWTPSWTIYSAGWCCLLMGFFYGVIDIKGKRKWAFPLVVVGMNSITMYVMADLFRGLFERSLKTNLGQNVFQSLGGSYAPIVEASTVLLIMWLICLWMYRRKLFLRI